MHFVRSSDSSQLQLTAEVGRGGEGSVFSVQGTPDLVVKLYHENLRAKRQAKIEAMVQVNSSNLAQFAAWPTFAVYEQSGARGFCGFAMPKVGPDYIPIHNLYGPSSRRQKFPGRGWRFLVRAAENLAAAIAEVHDAGHVLGDINHSNALVNNNALVQFIDVDSFQVRYLGTLHRCTVGVPEFTPPELQGLALSSVNRTVQHDRFGLAVLIFKLLFMGRHPFAGRFMRGDVSLPDAIKQGLFAYSPTMANEATPPPNTLDLQDVGDNLSTLFDKAFLTPLSVDQGRPDGHTWVNALKQLQRDINRCRDSPHHYYPGGTGSCIWCDFRAVGIDYFPDPGTQAPPPPVGGMEALFSVDDALVARLWAAIAAIPKRPGFDESMQRHTFEVAPLPPLRASVGWSVDEGIGCWGLAAAGGGFVFLGPVGFVAAAGLVALYAVVGPVLQRQSISSQERKPQRKSLEEKTRQRKQQATRLSAIQSIITGAVQEHENSWQRLMSDLTEAHQELSGRDAAKEAEIRTATERLSVGQRKSYLQSQLLRTASIHGVGGALTSKLISYGFESAFDVLNAGTSTSTTQIKAKRRPKCPQCGSNMRKRTARRGRNAGRDFWGCSRYPSCKGTRNISHKSTSYSHSTKTTTSSGLEIVPGIGPVKAADLTRWARQVEMKFQPKVNPVDLAREKKRIEAVHRARVQQLAQQLRGGPAELASINNQFNAKSSSYVLQFQALMREW